jgi:hypothetical protein
MAGDWIKMRTNLWTDGRVRLLARLLKCNVATVTGVTFRLWSIADQHSIDGVLNGYDAAAINDEVGVPGAAEALSDERIGWLVIESDRVIIPRFNEHNGESAKRRAQENARVRAWRKAQKCNGFGNAATVSKPVTREEKRREENISNKSTLIELPENLNTPACKAAWDEWLAYKAERRERYKSAKTINAKLTSLSKLGPERMVRAIAFSIEQGYQGIFEPKSNGVTNSRATAGQQGTIETVNKICGGAR